MDGKKDLKNAYFALPIRQENRKWLKVEIPIGRGDLRVHMSPIWAISCSQNVHQNSQTSCGLDETLCMSDHNIHKRQFAASTIKRESQVLAKLMVVLFEALGFFVNYKNSALDPQQSMEFLGFFINSRSMPLSSK